MFGDVFNNRATQLGTSEAGPTEPPTPLSTNPDGSVAPSWQPLVATINPASTKQYGYDPWTKSFYKSDRRGIRWWCFKPRSSVWHASLQYTLGSVLFVVASIFALFNHVHKDVTLNRCLFAYPYAVGSVMYTIGASILVVVSWSNHPDWIGAEQRPRLQAPASVAASQPRPPARSEYQRTGTEGADDDDDRDDCTSGYDGNFTHPPYSSYNVSSAQIAMDDDEEEPSLPTRIMVHNGQRYSFGDVASTDVSPKTRAAKWASEFSGSPRPVRGSLPSSVTPVPSAIANIRSHARDRGSPPAPTPIRLGRKRSAGVNSGDLDGSPTGKADEDDQRSVGGSVDDGSIMTNASERSYNVGRFMGRWQTTSTAENISTALLAYHDRRPEAWDAIVRQYYTRDAHYHIRADPWYRVRWRLDLAGSLSIWIGAILYNVSCFTLAYKAAFLEFPPGCTNSEFCEAILEVWPDIIGGVLFVLGSWFFWWAAHETPWPWGVPKAFDLTWWLTFFNIMGSIGFYYGAASHIPIGHHVMLVPNWFELLIGYVFGSAFFLIGSYLMIVEIASTQG